jgi:hypothetical protein
MVRDVDLVPSNFEKKPVTRCKKRSAPAGISSIEFAGAGEGQWNVKACDRPSQKTDYSFAIGWL